MANNNYLANILELNESVINDEESYKAYTFGIARLMQESLEISSPEELVSTLDYGIAMIGETVEIFNPALLIDLEYFTKLQMNLVEWKKAVDFANSLKIH